MFPGLALYKKQSDMRKIDSMMTDRTNMPFAKRPSYLTNMSEFVSSVKDSDMIEYENDEQHLEKLFDERIKEADVTSVLNRAKKLQCEGRPCYDNYEYCANRLKEGIEVIKHHYTGIGSVRVIVKLSKDDKSLSYIPVKPKNRLWSYLRGARILRFSDMAGVVYGPLTSTFEARKN